MIITQQSGTNPDIFTGGVFKITANVVNREDFINPTFNYDTGECCYVEKVFAEVGGEDWKNDKRNFIITLSIPSDTVTWQLFKNGALLANITDNTYGVFSPVGTYTQQPLATTFYADFEKIFALEGSGCYQIRADRVIINVGSNKDSIEYILRPYTPIGAKNSVKITSVQDGTIEGFVNFQGPLKYKGIVFENQLRLPIDSSNIEPLEEVYENYRSTSGDVEQVQSGLFESYRIKTLGISSDASDQLFKDMLLGNEIYLTGYDLTANKTLIDVAVFKKGIESQDYPQGQTLGFHEFILQNRGFIRKRNI